MNKWLWIMGGAGYILILVAGVYCAYCWHRLPDVILKTLDAIKDAYTELNAITKIKENRDDNQKK